MTVGTGILLFVIGAILAFAVHVELEAVNINMIGYILMGAGVVVAIIGLILFALRRGRGTTPVE